MRLKRITRIRGQRGLAVDESDDLETLAIVSKLPLTIVDRCIWLASRVPPSHVSEFLELVEQTSTIRLALSGMSADE